MTEPARSHPVSPRDESLIRRRPRSLQSVLPIVAWLPAYRWKRELRADVVAGITLAALLIPESMGYAGVAGVAPEVGLYAALGAVFAYAVTGGTSILVVGPASAVAALSASIVGEFSGDVEPVVLTAALAIASGVLLIAAGVLRVGWIVNFISRPVLHAFVAGLSISIIVGQLDGLLGVELDGESALNKFVDVVRNVDAWDGLTVAVGFGAVVALVVLERFAPRVPAAVLVVVVGIALVVVFDLDAEGVAIVGDIPSGLPDVGVPDLSTTRWIELLGSATALLLVGYSEGYASATAVAAHTGEEIDADQELIGAGAANMASGLLGGLAVSGSLSKSAASQAAGARTQMTNVVGGMMVLATLLFLAPVFEELPEPVLAAIVIAAVMRSADPRRVLKLWDVNRLDFVAAATTFVLVIVWETLPAMIVGVFLSLAFLVRRASFPDVVELRPGAQGVYARVEPGTTDDGFSSDVAVIRFEAPLVYANGDRLRQAVRTLISDRPGLARLVLDAEMWSDMDSSGGEVLEALDTELTGRGIELRLARVHLRGRDQIDRSALAERFTGRLYATVSEAAGSLD